MIRASGLSDIGPIRKNNEDSFASDEGLRLFVVADGMGGHSAGEIASSLAVETIVSFIRRSEDDAEFSWPYGVDSKLSFCGNRLRTAMHLANRRVFREAERRHDEYTGMGTTVVGALISGSRMAVGNAGDSRLYLFRDGTLTRLTNDDTWEATVPCGRCGPRAGTGARPANASCAHECARGSLSHRHSHERIRLAGGDVILLCSDGLHGVVDDHAISEVLSGDIAPASLAPRLIQLALTGGTRDNVTAVLARYEGK